MSTSTIITLICIVTLLYGSTGFLVYKCLTTKEKESDE
ncbi:hypothetical protein CPRO_16340 [Anaerotignum propionicum DSM 1682]|jgi:amino acid permease|uniref:MetS family NSS transporter small subunit n=1 Tax=Anaerotignum propionicum DSM 1682 TaxID=991789 RepID=A0ABM5YAV3_ANAPI|nr:hypothetical protein CPRO_16340 [Anaerotignum propionicum DSM 1682]